MIDRGSLAEFCRTNAEAIICRFFARAKKQGTSLIMADTTGAEGSSLHVTLDGKDAGLWYDFAAAEGGDMPRLLMAHFKVGFPEAVELLERAFGVSFRIPSPNNAAAPA